MSAGVAPKHKCRDTQCRSADYCDEIGRCRIVDAWVNGLGLRHDLKAALFAYAEAEGTRADIAVRELLRDALGVSK